jgi:SOS-response transcriptional repressor LexA
LIGFAGGAGTIPVPVLHVEEGALALAPEDHLTLDRRLVPSDDAFLVRATHEPAPEFGVSLGDLVLVHPSARARETDAVIVRVGHTVFVRRLTRRGSSVVLEAPGAGLAVEFGPSDDYTVLGVLAGVIRAILPREP